MSKSKITECPCCGWSGYRTPPETEHDAVLACEWCTSNINGDPHLCSRAQEITDRMNRGEQ